MIVFVDNEHDSIYDTPVGKTILAARTRIKYRLEDISGEPCLIVRYTQVTPDLLRQLQIRAVFISGNAADADQYDPADQTGLRAAICEETWPTFGFCGGFQTLAETYGAALERIGPLAPGEADPAKELGFAPGMKKEYGYQPVRLLKDHPLLAGLGDAPVMRQAHAWEIKTVPTGFELYASTEVTPVQMIVHQHLPIIGTQFHPEYYTDEHPAGRTLIENFCRWAGFLGDKTR